MARFASAFRCTGAGSNTLPMASLYAPANNSLLVFEVGVFNTSTSALAIALCRLTTTGTQGTGATEVGIDDSAATALGTAFQAHTVAPTGNTSFVRYGELGAAIGSGVIWTFGERGFRINNGTGNGIGVICPTGTSQVCDVYFEWGE